jgi:PncC family amidohydrolase
LVSAALLAQPGASAYFRGGAVVYTREARRALLGVPDAALDGVPPNSEPLAALLADAARNRLGATWGLGETGAAGPTGNRYGHPAGRACLAVAGPAARSVTLETGSADRTANMRRFGEELLRLLVGVLEG